MTAAGDLGHRYAVLGLFTVTWVFCLLAEWYYLPVPVGETGAAMAEGSLVGKVMWLPPFVLAGWIVLRRPELAWAVVRHANPFLFVMIGLALVSVLWSQDAGATLRRSVKLAGVAAIALALTVAAWEPLRFERWLRRVFLLFMAGSLVAVPLVPQLATHQEGELVGYWNGLTNNKNTLGMVCALGVIFWVHGWAAGRVAAWKALAVLALALMLVPGVRSTTSLLLMVASSGLVVALLRSPVDLSGQRLALLLMALLGLVVPVYTFMIATGSIGFMPLLESFTEAIGKDVTLTGRSDIWALVLEAYQHWPWLGAGYGAFWLGEEVGWSRLIAEALYWVPHQAHNGYLDVLNELGIVGLAVLVAYLATFALLLGRLWQLDPRTAALHIAVFVYMLVSNITESDFFRPMFPLFILNFMSTLEVARQLLEHRLRALHAPGTVAARSGPIPGLKIYRGRSS